MAKLCSLYAILLLLSTSGALLMVMVAGDTCKVDLGNCKHDCNSRCSKLHEGGQGICGLDKHCWCTYDCTHKICDVSLGVIGGCDDKQCDIDCAKKYPGQGTTAYCYSVGEPIFNSCHCQYWCQ